VARQLGRTLGHALLRRAADRRAQGLPVRSVEELDLTADERLALAPFLPALDGDTLRLRMPGTGDELVVLADALRELAPGLAETAVDVAGTPDPRYLAWLREARALERDLLAASLARIEALGLDLPPGGLDELTDWEARSTHPDGAADETTAVDEAHELYTEVRGSDPLGWLLPWIRAGNESAAVSHLRMIVSVQQSFRDSDRDQNGTSDFAPSLAVLGGAGPIGDALGRGERRGYRFRLDVPADRSRFSAWAEPIEPGASGSRWFFADEAGVIRFATDGPAHADSLPIGA
jgi:hypothetical protein